MARVPVPAHIREMISSRNPEIIRRGFELLIEPINKQGKLTSQDVERIAASQHYFNQGEGLYSKGKYHEAISKYIRAMEIWDSPLAYMKRAYAKAKAGDVRGALDDLSASIDRSLSLGEFPKPLAYFKRGTLKAMQGDLAGGIEDLNVMISFEPNESMPYCNRGVAEMNLGRHTEAAEDLAKALELDPRNVTAIYNLGLLRARMNMQNEAMHYLTRAVEIMPGHVEAHCDLGALNYQMGSFNDALAHVDRALQLEPGHERALMIRGLVQERIRN